MDINLIVKKQREYFGRNETLSTAFRLTALQKLRTAIRENKVDINKALRKDLGRAGYENYMAETGFVLEEINNAIKKLAKWTKNKNARTSLAAFPSRGYIQYEPYGTTLIMAPWNYPFQLSIVPLIGSIAAGNTAVVKPSAYAPATSGIIADLLSSIFDPEYVCVVEGGRDENSRLLDQDFDFIFFTGSAAVGKVVMEKASHGLTPVCLELGGKSPVIVDETAKIPVAARRIVFGKFLNAGQTCVAPDYLFVHERVRDELIKQLIGYTKAFFEDEPLKYDGYPKIINKKHFDRINGLLKDQDILLGGDNDGESRIAPTFLNNVDPDSPVMQEEIFGPVLPIMTYSRIDEPIGFIKNRDKPLALYLFTGSRYIENRVLRECSFGGGCVNDTIMHLSSSALPFGGVGASGMGNYHGEYSFKTFSHEKSILKRGLKPDVPLRYHPYVEWKKLVLESYWR